MKAIVSVTSVPKDDPYVTTLFKNIQDNRHLIMRVPKGETIFSQGDRADSVYFIQSGSVKISVLSYAGKQAVLAILGPHGFFGEESLADQSLRTNTAAAIEPSTLLQVEKREMVRVLYAQPDF